MPSALNVWSWASTDVVSPCGARSSFQRSSVGTLSGRTVLAIMAQVLEKHSRKPVPLWLSNWEKNWTGLVVRWCLWLSVQSLNSSILNSGSHKRVCQSVKFMGQVRKKPVGVPPASI